jgi:hypothetical protein
MRQSSLKIGNRRSGYLIAADYGGTLCNLSSAFCTPVTQSGDVTERQAHCMAAAADIRFRRHETKGLKSKEPQAMVKRRDHRLSLARHLRNPLFPFSSLISGFSGAAICAHLCGPDR